MKKLSLGLVGLMLSASALLADVNVLVTNIPQKVFVEKIGGGHVNVEAMVPPGANPHTYKPKPQQMVSVSKADLYFTIGIEFEEAWMSKLSAQNKKMQIEKMHAGVTLLEFDNHEEDHDEHEHQDHHDHDKHDDHDKYAEHDDHGHHHHEGIDPHSWMSPSAVKIMAKNIVLALEHLDSKNASAYEKNYEMFLKEIEATDQAIKHELEHVKKGTKFMSFHPGFGYFAHEYGLEQIAIEFEGKEPKPKMLAHMIEEAKHEGIKTVITSPEFSDKAARTIAEAIGGSVVKLSPVSADWSENLINLAKIIAKNTIKKTE